VSELLIYTNHKPFLSIASAAICWITSI